MNDLDLMTAIIISSLSHVETALSSHKPSHVISLVDLDDRLPTTLEVQSGDQHLRLSKRNEFANNSTRDDQCQALINFVNSWWETGPAAPLLVHCHRGVARSTAAAYIILCATQPEKCEKRIAAELRAAAPHAEPDLMLISEADAILGRDDRMIEAILDLCPSSTTVAAPIVTLPLAA